MSIENVLLLKSLKRINLACMFASACLFASHQAFSAPIQNENIAATTNNSLAGQTLVVAFSVIPPFVRLNESLTEPVGIDVDIIKELQRRTGFTLRNNKIEVMNFNEMMELGRENKVDILGGSISYTDSRAELFDVTEPYLTTSVSLVTTTNSSISDLKDLANKTVAVQRGTNMSDLLHDVPNVKLYEVPSTFMAFFAVSRGQADAMFIDTPVAKNYAHKWENGKLKVVKEIPGSQSSVCFLLKKNSPNNAALLKAFDEMRKDGTLERIFDKYIKNNN